MTVFSADTHPGHKRSHNEDCFLAAPEHGLYLVADGVGGHADGEVASAIVRETLKNDVAKGKGLVDSIQHSHKAILKEINQRVESNMGSTVVAALLKDSEYDIAWVGDSRAYRFDGELKQITRDHNPVSEMLARGAITAEQAAVHPERNVLSQSLGVSETIKVAPGRIRGDFKPGQQILLCSDGLTDELSDPQIAQIMSSQDSVETQVSALIEAALDAGGRDNVTVVVVGDKASASSRSAPARGEHSTLNNAPAVSEQATEGESHDSKILILLGVMGALAALWVALKVF